MTDVFDVIIMGTGPAAGRIAERCRPTMTVAMVEAREVGGECALRGCNPKKVFVNAAELIERVNRSDGRLLQRGNGGPPDWEQLVRFKNQFTDPVPEKSLHHFQELGIRIFHGAGHFVSEDQVAAGSQILKGKAIAVCTGAHPVRLNISGEEHVITSEQFMDSRSLPQSVLFIGGGYIAFEFAHVVRRFGREVTIVDRNTRPLSSFDADLVEKLSECSKAAGIDIRSNTEVVGVRARASGFEVDIERDGKRTVLTTGLVVHAAGRVPSVEQLNAEAGKVTCTKRGIAVNQFLQSVSNSRVFAAGDVADTDQPRLTPVANEQGYVIGRNLCDGLKHVPKYGPVPCVVFSIPPLGSVGLTESQARKEQRDIEVLQGDMTNWGSVKKVCAQCAGYKLVVDRQSQRLLGAHVLGPAAEETINLFTVAMHAGMTRKELKRVPLAFPTFTADVRKML